MANNPIVQAEEDILFSIEGLAGPEAVRYDPGQDVYFVSNFNGSPNDDANGFISKIGSEGSIESLEFMTGSDEHPMHGPRGMVIVGDILWACDQNGIHGFNRITGDQSHFVDLSSLGAQFPNDITATPEGVLYVTDHARSAVYRIEDGSATVFQDGPHLINPNGITWNRINNNLVLGPWKGINKALPTLSLSGTVDTLTTLTGGFIDGIEITEKGILLASQMDSLIYRFNDGVDTAIIKTAGKPADIGVDTQRNRIAVPYIDLNRVDVWQLQ